MIIEPSYAWDGRSHRPDPVTTMTQSDIDQGRLICVIGVAALKPAEFVIFRIGQWTADHKE